MNTVNYNDAEQLFGAVGTSLKKHTAEIADNVNVYGAKNLLPLTIGGIKSANSNASWSGNSCTINGVTFTILTDNDGNVTGIQANGTATSNATLFIINNIESYEYPFGGMILSGGVSSYEYVRIEMQDSPWTTFAISGTSETIVNSSVTQQGTSVINTYIRVLSGYTSNNSVFKPMIRLASIKDDTYVPYAKTNQQLTQETTGLIDNDFANGAVNLLQNTATALVASGVTFTVNDDGTITLNGTVTDSGYYFQVFKTYNSNKYPLIAGKRYKLSGCPSGGGQGTFRIYLEMHNMAITGTNDTGDGVTFTAPVFDTNFAAYIRVFPGQTFNNKVFKPMITLADMPNSDYAHYVPYAKSNKELTDDISSLAARIKAIEDVNHLTWG